jgi:hypothetical protein
MKQSIVLCQIAVVAACLAAVLAVPGVSAHAAPTVRYGIQDDAWLRYGPGTLTSRVARLKSMGVSLVRINVIWNSVEPANGTYSWSEYDELLGALHRVGIEPVLTLLSTPSWANGGKGTNVAPLDGTSFGAFARAAAVRYPYVRRWLIWNEPNQRRWLLPDSPSVYVTRLLNPAYAAIHAANPRALVGGGVTAPRASTGGVSPVAWIAGMAKAHARLDAYAHNPYPLNQGETPLSGGCTTCTTITMSTIGRLVSAVDTAFGPRVRIWLTEFGFQTDPPDTFVGVSYDKQAQYVGEAALRAYVTARVDMLVQYLLQDEPDPARWQSGLLTSTGAAKPSYEAFEIPFAEMAHTATSATLWAQIRPAVGGRHYALQERRGGRWVTVGGVLRAGTGGVVKRVVTAQRGAQFRIVDAAAGVTTPALVLA